MASVKPMIVKWNGADTLLAPLCKSLGVPRDTVRKRILRGWCVEDAVNMDLKRRPKYVTNGAFSSNDSITSVIP